MAEIPSDIASSAAQAGFQARQVAKERDAHRAGSVDAAERQVKAVDEADSTVDTEDGDTAVFTNAEGQGSEGRSFEDLADENLAEQDEARPPNGVSTDDDGQTHLDIQA